MSVRYEKSVEELPRDLRTNPRVVGAAAEIFGLIALEILIFTVILSILLITKTIDL